jgi:hypothetical protein
MNAVVTALHARRKVAMATTGLDRVLEIERRSMKD